jgi:hypothetical protein
MLTQKISAFQNHPNSVVGNLLLKLLRNPISIDFLAREQIKIEDYVKTLGTQTIINSLLLEEKFLGTLYCDEDLMFYFIDRMMGGTRAPYIKQYSEGLSKIDISNVDNISSQFDLVLGEYLFGKRLTHKIHHLPFDLMSLPIQEELTILSFKVKCDGHSGHLALGIGSKLL